jgi:anti-anti-sigma regulatory factor
MRAHNKVESLGTRMVVMSPTAAVLRVLELMGLDCVMDIRSGSCS